MKAELTERGTLVVRAETPLESYALLKWSESQESLPEEILIETYQVEVLNG